jgi:molybdopterin molybdotransferase
LKNPAANPVITRPTDMALLPVFEALDRILKLAKPTSRETVALVDAMGRALAKDIAAKRDQPPFLASAMDGFAVRHADLQQTPTTLNVVGVSAAGKRYTGKLKKGQAVRILTGAPVPGGADTVIIQENVSVEGACIVIHEVPEAGKNIRFKGLDFKSGSVLVQSGQMIRPRLIGLAAAANAGHVVVHRKPRVTLFTTGDELVMPGKKPNADQIVSSNSLTLQAFADKWGAQVHNLGIIKDSPRAIRAAITKGLQSDILLTTGGASVGDHDYVQSCLQDCGFKIDFWKIALRPGKPLMFGHRGSTVVLGLPGNPVSAIVCARLFLRPFILKMLGLPDAEESLFAEVMAPLPANDGRQDFIRAKLERSSEGLRFATPFARQDSSMQRVLAEAGCLIIRPPHAPAAKAGDKLPILKFED